MELQFCLEQVCSQGRSTQHAVFAGQAPGGAIRHIRGQWPHVATVTSCGVIKLEVFDNAVMAIKTS